MRHDGGGRQAELHFAQGKARGLHCHDQIAGGHQTEATGKRIALHPRDHGLGAFGHGAQHMGELQSVVAVLRLGVSRQLLHVAQIGPGAERRALRGQHHATHFSLLTEFHKGRMQRGDGGGVEGVAHFGAMKGDRGNGPFALDDDRGFAHGLGEAVASSRSM